MGLFSQLTGKRRSSLPEAEQIGSAKFKADPFPCYARLRAEAPVSRMTLLSRHFPDGLAWNRSGLGLASIVATRPPPASSAD